MNETEMSPAPCLDDDAPTKWSEITVAGLALVTLAFVVLINGFMVFARRYISVSSFPGPLPFPIVGNILDPLLMGSLIRYIKRNREAYGAMWTFWPGNKPVVVCMEPQNVRQILADAKRTAKPASYTSVFAVPFGKGLVTSNGEQHKQDRACLGRYFVNGNLEPLLPLICECADAGISRFIRPHAGTVMDTVHGFHMTTLRIATRMIASWDAWDDMTEAEGIADYVTEGSTLVGEFMAFGLPFWTIFPKVKESMRKLGFFQRLATAKVQARRALVADPTATAPDDPLTAMVRGGMDDILARDQIISLVSAGHDTTTFFISYLCMALGENPDIQDKVRAELRMVFGNRTSITRDDLDQLRYLQQVMQETLRLYPVIPFLFREVTEDMTLKATGHTVTAGTDVLLPLSHINRDKKIWANPNVFNPDRMAGVSFTSPKHGFFPFAYGSRICIGNSLAILEAKVIVSKILRQYRVRPDPDFKLKILAGISLVAEKVNVIFEEAPLVC